MSYPIYADIIIDISHENLDKTYQYAIPEEYVLQAVIGALVVVPFGRGNRKINGYIVGLSGEPKISEEMIKPISQVVEGAPVIESHLIYLAYWMKETFGGTMNDSLKTVIPVRKAVKIKEQKSIQLAVGEEQANQLYFEYQRKNNKAKLRLLEALLREKTLDYDIAVNKLNIPRTTLQVLESQGITKTTAEQIYRNPIKNKAGQYQRVELNKEQSSIVEDFCRDYSLGRRSSYLIHGITGSGKTEVYMEIIASVIAAGKQVIMLIPEIALTYQTVLRFYQRFGERISIMNSKMSQGERYDQSQRARNGGIDIIIGPRSALFTPFQKLGLIIVDEEHEYSYKSETVPKYHAVDVAMKRAQLTDASVILGSATPSLETYLKAKRGEITLYTLTKRAKEAEPPVVWITDLREELKKKNKSIFSEKLKELIIDRLNRKEQIMLFLNRRGYAGFVSCRSCGYVMKCPHCDVSLTSHNNGKLVCHYCGYEDKMPANCPQCGSKYIAAFGTGTQKVEELVKKEFPGARVLRMDADTTKNKGGHEAVLSAFAQHKADILVGTQMIVKGHDFPKVTLVGIIAADLSLYTGDFRASERTFQLLCQAAGRAGRDVLPGEVVIQTYHPEHYSILTAAEGNYEAFFEQEILYRRLMKYPPASNILLLLITSKDEEQAVRAASHMGEAMKLYLSQQMGKADIIGPAPAGISKANDNYRQVIYIKHFEYEKLIEMKDYLEGYFNYSEHFAGCNLQFDFNPMSAY
ncbi:MAG TPA: primosomal protein N' [Mobilitalea sp.]|nr:primosomal protein N' [Mobilitalea sp.]